MKKSLNIFLVPIVDEVKAFWKGLNLTNSQSKIPLTYRGALLLASADLPAVRKLRGFKRHSAHRGSSKSFKYFPGSVGEKVDYSGFDRGCGHHAIIAVITYIRKWFERLQLEVSMRH